MGHITILRPVKGVEVGLYDCLASTFRLAYPKAKLTIYLCVASTSDPAYPVLQRVIEDFPGFDAKILVEEDDPLLHGAEGHVNNLGPNPKIRNLSRGYREAKGDIIWIVDCNVWIGTGSAGRMVDKLCGFGPNGTRTTPYKFVHQLPLVVDIETPQTPEEQSLLSSNTTQPHDAPKQGIWSHGGRLEEMFMSTTHAKFYSAINTVSLAPCIVGKSNMFRKSHLDLLTNPLHNPLLPASSSSRGTGLDFFSSYICEDHLIGDLIWRSAIPDPDPDASTKTKSKPRLKFRNHGLVFGEPAVQPMSGMSVPSYIARRARWLRVRKWTVLAATLVEPGVESLVCCAHLAFALTTLPWFHNSALHVPPTWNAMLAIWLGGIAAWTVVDRVLFNKLHKLQSVEADEHTPSFALGTSRRGGAKQRPFGEWLVAWLGRELLALPIWTWAVLLGTTVNWRGKQFRVRMDMSVVEMKGQDGEGQAQAQAQKRRVRSGTPTVGGGRRSEERGKDRVD